MFFFVSTQIFVHVKNVKMSESWVIFYLYYKIQVSQFTVVPTFVQTVYINQQETQKHTSGKSDEWLGSAALRDQLRWEKLGFKKGRCLLWGVGAARIPGLLPAGGSPAEFLDPRPAACELPLELEEDQDLLLLEIPKISIVERKGDHLSYAANSFTLEQHYRKQNKWTNPLELELAFPNPFLFLEYLKKGAFFLFCPCADLLLKYVEDSSSSSWVRPRVVSIHPSPAPSACSSTTKKCH